MKKLLNGSQGIATLLVLLTLAAGCGTAGSGETLPDPATSTVSTDTFETTTSKADASSPFENGEDIARLTAGAVLELQVKTGEFDVGFGAAWLISDRLAVTAAHNVRTFGGPSEPVSLELGTFDGKTVTAEVVASDANADVALLRLSEPVDHPPLVLADGSEPGQPLMTIGHPGASTALGGWIVTVGHQVPACASVPQMAQDILQHDIDTAAGNSGGPVLDESGKVVGLISLGLDIDSETCEPLGLPTPAPAEVLTKLRSYDDTLSIDPNASTIRRLVTTWVEDEGLTLPDATVDDYRSVEWESGDDWVGTDVDDASLERFRAGIALWRQSSVVILFDSSTPDGDGQQFFVAGSGALVDDDLVLTASHIVAGFEEAPPGAPALTAYALLWGEDTPRELELVTKTDDELDDVAILRLAEPHDLPVLSIASADPEVGDPVIVIGHPGLAVSGLGSTLTTAGKIVESDPRLARWTAPGFQGQSGGPVLNADGEIVSLVSAGDPPVRPVVPQRLTVREFIAVLTGSTLGPKVAPIADTVEAARSGS